MLIYTVIGSSGHDLNKPTWLVGAYYTQSAANKHAKEANYWAASQAMANKVSSMEPGQTAQPNPHDPTEHGRVGLWAHRYAVKPCDLFGTPPTGKLAGLVADPHTVGPAPAGNVEFMPNPPGLAQATAALLRSVAGVIEATTPPLVRYGPSPLEGIAGAMAGALMDLEMAAAKISPVDKT